MANVQPAASAAKLGGSVGRDDVAKAHKVPLELLDTMVKPKLVTFTAMELARMRFAPLVATIKPDEDYRLLTPNLLAKHSGATGATPTAVSGAKEKLSTTAWSSVGELLAFYEEVMLPIRLSRKSFETYQLSSFHCKDDLKRGLGAFSQEHLDKEKKELTEVQGKMEVCQAFIKKAGSEAFTTEIFNDIANILRIGGEKHEHAHRKALSVLEDMSLCGIPYNDITFQIVQAASFNDGPLDDSALLFSLIESPEMGEVSIADAPLEKAASDTLRIVSARHQTPLDDGVLLQQRDTYPCLQHSEE